jgi:hypothetical protein
MSLRNIGYRFVSCETSSSPRVRYRVPTITIPAAIVDLGWNSPRVPTIAIPAAIADLGWNSTRVPTIVNAVDAVAFGWKPATGCVGASCRSPAGRD